MEGGCPKGGGWPKSKKSEANLRRYAPPPSRGGRSGMSSPSTPFLWKGVDGQGVGRRRKRAKPTSGATRHLLPKEGGRSGESHLPPSRGRGMPEGQGGGRRRKRAKPNSGAMRHLLPEEGGKSGKSHLPPSRGRGMPEGRGLAEDKRERSQPPALRATSFQRKEGEVG